MKYILSCLLCFSLIFCQKKNTTYNIVNKELKYKIKEFVQEHKDQLDENVIMILDKNIHNEFKVFISGKTHINDPFSCNLYFGKIRLYNHNLYLYCDSILLKNNPLVELNKSSICPFEPDSISYLIESPSKEFIYKDNTLKLVQER